MRRFIFAGLACMVMTNALAHSTYPRDNHRHAKPVRSQAPDLNLEIEPLAWQAKGFAVGIEMPLNHMFTLGMSIGGRDTYATNLPRYTFGLRTEYHANGVFESGAYLAGDMSFQTNLEEPHPNMDSICLQDMMGFSGSAGLQWFSRSGLNASAGLGWRGYADLNDSYGTCLQSYELDGGEGFFELRVGLAF